MADEWRVPATFPGRQCWALRLVLLLSRDNSSSGLSGGWSSSRISSGPPCQLSHDMATPCKARHPSAVAGNKTPAVLCSWAALGGCSQCLRKLELQCLWGGHHEHKTLLLASLLEKIQSGFLLAPLDLMIQLLRWWDFHTDALFMLNTNSGTRCVVQGDLSKWALNQIWDGLGPVMVCTLMLHLCCSAVTFESRCRDMQDKGWGAFIVRSLWLWHCTVKSCRDERELWAGKKSH